jgi:hypothetical protein
MIMSVRGVDAEPVFRRVATALCMRAFAFPVVLSHQREELDGGRTRAAQGIKGRGNIALVISQAGGAVVLIVALNDGVIFLEQLP